MPWVSSSAEEPDPRKLVLAASESAIATWEHGKAEGKYIIETVQGDVLCNAKFTVQFVAGDFRMDVTFDRSHPKTKRQGSLMYYDRRISFSDRASITVNNVSPLIQPAESTVEILDRRPGSFTRVADGLLYDLAKLPQQILDFKQLEKAMIRPIYSTNEAGDIVGKYPLGKSATAIFVCAKRFDFNVSRFTLTEDKTGAVLQEETISWTKTNRGWHIDSIVCEETGRLPKRTKLAFDSVDLDYTAAADQFSLDSIRTNPDARIIDRRPLR